MTEAAHKPLSDTSQIKEFGSLLVLAAYPADVVGSCGGTLSLQVAAGRPVCVAVASEAGSQENSVLVAASEAAAAVLGYATPEAWSGPGGASLQGYQLTQKILETLLEKDVTTLFAPSSLETDEARQALTRSALEAIQQSRRDIRLVQYECTVPLQANLLINVSGQLEHKRAAADCFAAVAEVAMPLDGLLALNRFRACHLGPEVTAAEAFRVFAVQDGSVVPVDADLSPAWTTGPATGPGTLPLVSVIVRSMDRASLPEALDSIAAQLWPHIELVVVNAKGKGHARLASRWGRLPLRLVGSGQSLSRTQAANIGLAEAHGRYLCFLDDDDLFLPEHISGLLAELNAHPAFRAAYAGVRVEVFAPDGVTPDRTFNFNESFSRAKLWARNFIPMHAMLFEKALLDEGCRFDESLELFEDWDFWLQISQYTDFVHVDKVSAIYRNRGHSGLTDESNPAYDAALVKRAMAKVYDKWASERTGMDWADIILFRDQRWEAAERRITELYAKLAESDLEREHHLERIQRLQERTKELEIALVQREQQSEREHSELIQRLQERTKELEIALVQREQQSEREHSELIQCLQERTKEFETALAEREQQMQALNGLIAEKEQANAALMLALDDEINLRDQTILQYSRALQRNHGKIQALEGDLGEQAERAAWLQSQIHEAHSQLDQRRFEMSRLEDESWRLAREVEWIQGRLDALIHSTSWKITVPLRVFSHLAQGRHGLLLEAMRQRLGKSADQPPPGLPQPEPAATVISPALDLSPEPPYDVWMRWNLPQGNRLRSIVDALGISLFPRHPPSNAPLEAPHLVAWPEHKRHRNLWDHRRKQGLSGPIKMDQLLRDRFARTNLSHLSHATFQGNPYLLGYAALGPVLLGFTHWLVQRHEQEPVKAFVFLSRDGYFLKAAYDIVANALGAALLPSSHYVAASRVMCALATMNSLERIYEAGEVDHHPMPVGVFLGHRFGFTQQRLQPLLGKALKPSGFASLDDPIVPGDIRKRNLLKILSPAILRHAEQVGAHYRAYLENLGLDWAHSPLVDIGYSGTSQAAMASLLGVKLTGRYLITSCRATRLDSSGLPYESWLAHQVKLEHPFFQHVQLWELLLSATHGSINRIHPQTLEPVEDEPVLDAYSCGILALVRRGALDFVAEFMQAHHQRFNQMAFPAEACASTLTHYFEHPAADDCVYFSKIVFEDRYGGDVRPLLLTLGNTRYLASLASKSVWPAASHALTDQTPVTPFWPAWPLPGSADATAGYRFIDGVARPTIQPACFSAEFASTFDMDGFPVARDLPIKVRVVIPVSDALVAPVMASLTQQLSRGFSVLLVGLTAEPTPAWENDTGIGVTGVAVQDGAAMLEAVRQPGAEWIVLTDGETALEPTAIAEWIAAGVDADVVIGDDDELRAERRTHPHFKPALSPELLAATDYFGGAWLVRRECLRQISAESADPRAWLWEIALGLVRSQAKIVHVPRVLTHRLPVHDQNRLARTREEACRLVGKHFSAWGSPCAVEIPEWSRESGRLVCQPVFPDTGPEVAIIIPTKNQHTVVARCLDSLQLTTYENYRIYLIDNDSDDAESLAYFAALPDDRITVLKIGNLRGAGFSYSRINNLAVAQTRGEAYLLFLNNDTEVIEPRWLSQMVGWQHLPGVGSVGALLYFPNDRIQHAGITHKLLWNVLPAPSLKWVHRDEPSYQDYARLARDSAAQTAACLLTPRTVFDEFGRFDATDFNIAYNDCDYGFKLTQSGLRNVYCPEAVLYHHEGLTRGTGKGNDRPSEEAAFVQKYALWDDPYYSPNLATGRTDFAIQPCAPVTTPVPALRLAVATHNLLFEGAPLVLFEIVQEVLREGAAEVLVISMQDGPLRSKYENLGCTVRVIPEPIRLFKEEDACMEALMWVTLELAAAQTDVVLANTVLTWWAVEAAEAKRLPSLWIIHESETALSHLAEHGNDCVARGRRALSTTYRTIFVSWATREVFRELECRSNFHTIYNGFDSKAYEQRIAGKSRRTIRQQLGLSEGKLLVLVPGTICPRKSQIDIIKAIPLLPENIRERISLFLVGDRPNSYSDELHRQLACLNPNEQAVVRVLPHCEQIEDYFLAADIMASSARVEAFPKVIQEGMYFRLPMLVTPVFGVNEQVTDEVSALFFPVGDSMQFAKQLERLVRDEHLRTRLSQNAHDSLGRFPDVTAMGREYLKLIREAWLSS